MGNTTSDSSAEAPRSGYRILSVEPRSPGSNIIVFPDPLAAREGHRALMRSQLVAYLDIITSVNGILLDADALEADVLSQEVNLNREKPIILEVYNVKHNRYSTCQVTPSSNWGGDGLMGVQVRFDVLDDPATLDAALHVVGVDAGSPAALAGLEPEDDYVLGCAHCSFASVDAFADYASSRLGEEVQLFVLRRSTDSVRVTTLLVTDDEWGVAGGPRGTGLGLELAVGHLHGMPNRTTCGINEAAVPAGAVAAAVAAEAAGTAAGLAGAPVAPEVPAATTTAAAASMFGAPPAVVFSKPPPAHAAAPAAASLSAAPHGIPAGSADAAHAHVSSVITSGAGKDGVHDGGDHHGHSHGEHGCGHDHGNSHSAAAVVPLHTPGGGGNGSSFAGAPPQPAATVSSPFAFYSQPAPPQFQSGGGFPVAASRFQVSHTGQRPHHAPVYPAPGTLTGAPAAAAH